MRMPGGGAYRQTRADAFHAVHGLRHSRGIGSDPMSAVLGKLERLTANEELQRGLQQLSEVIPWVARRSFAEVVNELVPELQAAVRVARDAERGPVAGSPGGLGGNG